MRLLLAEDSARLQTLVRDAIHAEGYLVDVVGGVQELLSAASLVSYGLLIVDLGLPDGDGIDAIRALRTSGTNAPILIITAREAVSDRIRGLDSGADDYLTKPFNNGELLARIRALLRRPSQINEPFLQAGPLQCHETNGEVIAGNIPIVLRPSERRLLTLLMRRSGTIVTRAMIEDALSEFGREVSPNAIEILISRLRKAIAVSVAGRVRIETIRGFGYALRTNEDV
jgi:DNA-binding response OmpR family regulator